MVVNCMMNDIIAILVFQIYEKKWMGSCMILRIQNLVFHEKNAAMRTPRPTSSSPSNINVDRPMVFIKFL